MRGVFFAFSLLYLFTTYVLSTRLDLFTAVAFVTTFVFSLRFIPLPCLSHLSKKDERTNKKPMLCASALI